MNSSPHRCLTIFAFIFLVLLAGPRAHAVVLWSHADAITVHENGAGTDLLGGAVKRNAKDGDALYFKFRVDPLSDVSKEEYYAGFQLFEDDTEKLGVGNSLKAWAYSAFNTEETGENNRVFGDLEGQNDQSALRKYPHRWLHAGHGLLRAPVRHRPQWSRCVGGVAGGDGGVSSGRTTSMVGLTCGSANGRR